MSRSGRLAVALAAVCLAAPLAASAVSGASQAPLQRVTVFGDSQLAGVEGSTGALAMLAKGIDLDLRAAVCRRLVQVSCPFGGVRPPTVLDEVRDEAKPLGTTVVVLVGYNDYEVEFARNVDTLMRAFLARGVTRVLWLTLTERRPDWTRMNALLRVSAKDWRELEVLDWSAATDPSWFQGDDIHLTGEGAMGLASYLHVALVVRGVAAPTTVKPVDLAKLRITIRGTGAVALRGTRCRASCEHLIPVGTPVRLTAKAPAGSVFQRWNGACTGRRVTCTVKVARGMSVVARFVPRSR